MPLNPDYLLTLDRDEIVQAWTWKDAAIYALGLGYGDDPLDRRQLRFLDKAQQMQAMPAMVNVLGYDGAWLRDEENTGVNYLKVVHGEQAMRLHSPLPVEGRIRARTRITELVDKGPGKGALIVTERQIYHAETGTPIATINHNIFCRGAGGFGGSPTQSKTLSGPPDRAPDGSLDIRTPPQLALIYRLSGDLNPLHADPDVAQKAGFERPILHGLSTFGIACRGLMATHCGADGTRVKYMAGRFSAPVFPGETLSIDYWTERPGRIAFELRVRDRDAIILENGQFDYSTET
jgi:acyl dehydratase